MAVSVSIQKFNHFVKVINDKLEEMEQKLSSDVGNGVRLIRVNIREEIQNFVEQLGAIAAAIAGIDSRLDYLEREQKACDMVISGIPNIPNTSPNVIFERICSAIDFRYDNSPQIAIFRVKINTSKPGSRQKPSATPLVVRFRNKHEKINFFNKYKQFGDLRLQHVQIDSTARIYCNDGLTKRNSVLFREAKQLEKTRNISKAFTKRGLVYIIKESNSNPVQISNIDQLGKDVKTSKRPKPVQLSNIDQLGKDVNTSKRPKPVQSSSSSPVFISKSAELINELVDDLNNTIMDSASPSPRMTRALSKASSTSNDKRS